MHTRLIDFRVLQKTTHYNIHGGQLEIKTSMCRCSTTNRPNNIVSLRPWPI